jgi:hypothetical protein
MDERNTSRWTRSNATSAGAMSATRRRRSGEELERLTDRTPFSRVGNDGVLAFVGHLIGPPEADPGVGPRRGSGASRIINAAVAAYGSVIGMAVKVPIPVVVRVSQG